PPDGRRRRVAVVGRAGTTIIDDVSEIEEFADQPWTSDQVAGQVVFEALQQTAGRRAVLRDPEAFPVFLDAVQAVEPLVRHTIERVAREVDEQTADRLNDVVRRIFGKVLKELADLDNPMRTAMGSEPGEGGLLDEVAGAGAASANGDGSHGPGEPPTLEELAPPRDPVDDSDTAEPSARPDRRR